MPADSAPITEKQDLSDGRFAACRCPLSGEWKAACEHCRAIRNTGRISPRRAHLATANVVEKKPYRGPERKRIALGLEYARELRRRATPAERHVLRLLGELDLMRMRFQRLFVAKGGFAIADFYIGKPLFLVLEIDGEYHFTPEQQRRDREREAYLRGIRRLRILRLTNQQALALDAEGLRARIAIACQEPRPARAGVGRRNTWPPPGSVRRETAIARMAEVSADALGRVAGSNEPSGMTGQTQMVPSAKAT